jgi:hypothetical protein
METLMEVSSTAPHTIDEPGNRHSIAVLRSPADIRQVDNAIHPLTAERHVTLNSQFFLASLSREWAPCVIAVRRGDDLVGVVYGKERTILGRSTGVVYIDGRLGQLIADTADQEHVMAVALNELVTLPWVRGVRLVIPPAGVDARAVTRVQSSADVDVRYSAVSPFELHAVLPLPASYAEFLEPLGSKTRRNFRYYARKFEAAGHTYANTLTASELHLAANYLRTKSRILSQQRDVTRALNVLAATSDPWSVGLKHRNGEWLSIAGGWHGADRATMFFQLNNDREHEHASLSVVLRAHLIETLITRGSRELLFWSGSAPPLSRYAAGLPAVRVHLDRSTRGWRLVRSAVRRTQPWMSKWITADMGWV